MNEAAIISVAATVLGSGAFIALIYYVGRRAGRIEVLRESYERQVKDRAESDKERDEISKLDKDSLCDLGSKWVRPDK